jgi:hypothetical protein
MYPDGWKGNKGLEDKEEGEEEEKELFELNIQPLQSVFVIIIVKSNISWTQCIVNAIWLWRAP